MRAPGEDYRAPLPATGREIVFPMDFGPVPDNRWPCELSIEFSAPQGSPASLIAHVDARRQGVRGLPRREDERRASLGFVSRACGGTHGRGSHEIKVAGKAEGVLTIWRVEASLKPASAAGR